MAAAKSQRNGAWQWRHGISENVAAAARRNSIGMSASGMQQR
jgi:hypothetical protein